MNKTDQRCFPPTTRPAATPVAAALAGLLAFCLLAVNAKAEPVNVQAEAAALTEQQALALFYQRNLDLLAARYNIENARANEIIASAIPNPILQLEMLELGHNMNQNSTSIGCSQAWQTTGQNHNCGPAVYTTFTQLVEMAGRRGLRMQSTAIATQAAESDFRDAVRIFSNMVRDAYYGLVQAQKNRWLMREIVDYYKEIVSSNRLRYQAGDIAESDFMRIEMEAMRANSDLDNAQAAMEQAQAALAQILNWPDKGMLFVAEEQWPAFKDIGQALQREQLINKALALRPDLQGDKQRADQAEKDLIRAQRLIYPDLTFNVGQANDPSNIVKNTYFLGVSATAPLFYQFQGEGNQALINLNQLRVAAEQTELGVRSDVVNSVAMWKSSNKVVQRYENELLERARKVRERMELAYRKGGTTVLDFIDAQREYKSVMLDYYTAAINRVNAYYDLAKSLGVEPDAELAGKTENPMEISAERQRKIQ
ncbi:MAG: TolC family protein [Methylomonas sp.]|jgi:cobalt-zinc-cadmium efflux system outer membrane protein